MTAEGISGEQRPIEQCGLDRTGRGSQLARYGELSRHVDTVKRWLGLLEVSFRPEVDVQLLTEALAVERECCPFFDLSYDASARQLAVSVEDPRHDAALDALRFALTPT